MSSTAASSAPVSTAGSDAFALVETGRYFYFKGNYEKARDVYRVLCLLRPDNPAVHTALGACEQMLGQYDIAIGHYQQALKRHPREVYAMVNMAECLIRNGHRPAARALLYRTIDLDERGSAGRRAVKLLKYCMRSVQPWDIGTSASYPSTPSF